ncbi:hypothetical protein L1987_78506 [Smallanthus sonchifolius]|uniref:Uncharacterized protein n=1 Tax=Smallanthus sonchifolius TaxID=185202 RepID=A0ACB8ZCV4_9ASTR|nr:hypothetical protein L1987_78506 [Smallanthus sonchifolius]
MAQSLATPWHLLCLLFATTSLHSNPILLQILSFSTFNPPKVGGLSIRCARVNIKHLLTKTYKKKALKKDVENDEKENKININKIDYGEVVEKSNDDGQDDEETLALLSELVEGHLDLYGAQPVEGPLAYGRFDVCLLSLKY